jgi:hypothetical protein
MEARGRRSDDGSVGTILRKGNDGLMIRSSSVQQRCWPVCVLLAALLALQAMSLRVSASPATPVPIEVVPTSECPPARWTETQLYKEVVAYYVTVAIGIRKPDYELPPAVASSGDGSTLQLWVSGVKLIANGKWIGDPASSNGDLTTTKRAEIDILLRRLSACQSTGDLPRIMSLYSEDAIPGVIESICCGTPYYGKLAAQSPLLWWGYHLSPLLPSWYGTADFTAPVILDAGIIDATHVWVRVDAGAPVDWLYMPNLVDLFYPEGVWILKHDAGAWQLETFLSLDEDASSHPPIDTPEIEGS